MIVPGYLVISPGCLASTCDWGECRGGGGHRGWEFNVTLMIVHLFSALIFLFDISVVSLLET